MTTSAPPQNNDTTSELLDAIGRLLLPVASLCLAKGVHFAAVEEQVKQVFVQAADSLAPQGAGHGRVSRISTATGLTRREVTRLVKADSAPRAIKQSASSELFARWTGDAVYRDESGTPLILNRVGDAPSFEALAHSITRDIHPRSMLDELLRLKIVAYDVVTDTVALSRSEFVPYGDDRQLFEFLGSNVGDHLHAAVQNITCGGNEHLEQAIFADELSEESVKKLRILFMEQWQAICDAVVPQVLALIEEDHKAGRAQDQRVRLGLYSYNENCAGEPPTDEPLSRPKRKYLQGTQK
jgi:hypothetical protein